MLKLLRLPHPFQDTPVVIELLFVLRLRAPRLRAPAGDRLDGAGRHAHRVPLEGFHNRLASRDLGLQGRCVARNILLLCFRGLESSLQLQHLPLARAELFLPLIARALRLLRCSRGLGQFRRQGRLPSCDCVQPLLRATLRIKQLFVLGLCGLELLLQLVPPLGHAATSAPVAGIAPGSRCIFGFHLLGVTLQRQGLRLERCPRRCCSNMLRSSRHHFGHLDIRNTNLLDQSGESAFKDATPVRPACHGRHLHHSLLQIGLTLLQLLT
mmetsp:Transcript_27212/g.65528  ORF Transcript_27212/g.65528 Transcript_27212/m.65528 type:complete len:268 (+) Transcript_27212:529-1332(+)